MASIADMVEQMFADGLSPSAIVAAIRVLESAMESVTLLSRDASRSVTQEQNRIRQQNWRNRKKDQQVAKANDVAIQAVTRNATHNVTAAVVANDSILLEGLPEGNEEKKERKKEVVAHARGTRLKSGEPLAPKFIKVALDLGMHGDQVAQLWAEFVDYWSDIPGNRGCKVSWVGTWRNRVKQVGSKGRGNGKTQGGSILDAFDEVIAATAESDRGAGEETILLLPFGPSRRP